MDIGWPKLHVERLYAAVGALVSCELSLTWRAMATATAMGGKWQVASGKWQVASGERQVSIEYRAPSRSTQYQVGVPELIEHRVCAPRVHGRGS